MQQGSPGAKGKRNRKSTDNLHPNLLPEDYLDEVIGQYFNADSSGDEAEQSQKSPNKAPVEKKTAKLVCWILVNLFSIKMYKKI